MTNTAIIRTDPHHPSWCNADGRNLLLATAAIPSVERTPTGITFHQDFRDEVISALDRANCRIIEDNRKPPARSAATRLSFQHPGDEAAECRRCNPAHNPAPAIADAKRAVAEAIARMKARAANIGGTA